jgi:hypothetical protein
MQFMKIADDEKKICLVNEFDSVLWTAGIPKLADWRRLSGGTQSDVALESGIFRWVNGGDDSEVVVVFSPYGGLDFNLTYSVLTGELLRIHEAR